jgi:hypothetical protein
VWIENRTGIGPHLLDRAPPWRVIQVFLASTLCDQALPPATSSRRIVIVEAPRTEDDRGRGANSSVQRKPTTALACEGYAKQSFGLPSLSSVLRLRRAKTAYKLLTLLFDQLHQLLSLQLL